MNEEAKEMDLEVEENQATNAAVNIEKEEKSEEKGHQHGFAITSTLLGVAAIIFMWILPYITFAASVTGLFFAIVSLKREKDTLSYLALTANVVALGLFILYFIMCVILGNPSFLSFVK